MFTKSFNFYKNPLQLCFECVIIFSGKRLKINFL